MPDPPRRRRGNGGTPPNGPNDPDVNGFNVANGLPGAAVIDGAGQGPNKKRGPVIETPRQDMTRDNYDQYAPNDAVDALSEIGVTGLNRVSGFVYEELLPELRGERGRKQIRMMVDEDPIIGAYLSLVELLCRQVSFDMEPPSTSNEDLKSAEWAKGVYLEDQSMTWQDEIAEIMQMVPWGFSYLESVYKMRNGDHPEDGTQNSKFDDGKIGIRKLSPRAQETVFRWQFDDTGGIKGMIQLAPPYFKFTQIPIEKSLLFRTTSRKNNPEGRSALRNCYTSFYYKRNLQRIEAIGIERDLAGFPLAWMPPQYLSDSATPGQRAMVAAVKRFVTNIRRDEQEGGIFPLAYDERGNKLFDFGLVSSGSRRTSDTSAIINRHDQRIAQSVLAEFIMLGMQNVGSFALASSKTDIFAIALGTYLDSIVDVINRYSLPRLYRLNGLPLKTMPKLKHGDIENVPLDELAAYITALSGAGAPLFPSPDGKLEHYILDIAGLPVSEDMYEVGREGEPAGKPEYPQKPGEAPPGSGAPGGKPGAVPEGKPTQEQVDKKQAVKASEDRALADYHRTLAYIYDKYADDIAEIDALAVENGYGRNGRLR